MSNQPIKGQINLEITNLILVVSSLSILTRTVINLFDSNLISKFMLKTKLVILITYIALLSMTVMYIQILNREGNINTTVVVAVPITILIKSIVMIHILHCLYERSRIFNFHSKIWLYINILNMTIIFFIQIARFVLFFVQISMQVNVEDRSNSDSLQYTMKSLNVLGNTLFMVSAMVWNLLFLYKFNNENLKLFRKRYFRFYNNISNYFRLEIVLLILYMIDSFILSFLTNLPYLQNIAWLYFTFTICDLIDFGISVTSIAKKSEDKLSLSEIASNELHMHRTEIAVTLHA